VGTLDVTKAASLKRRHGALADVRQHVGEPPETHDANSFRLPDPARRRHRHLAARLGVMAANAVCS
jgi:hypothetical protein